MSQPAQKMVAVNKNGVVNFFIVSTMRFKLAEPVALTTTPAADKRAAFDCPSSAIGTAVLRVIVITHAWYTRFLPASRL